MQEQIIAKEGETTSSQHFEEFVEEVIEEPMAEEAPPKLPLRNTLGNYIETIKVIRD